MLSIAGGAYAGVAKEATLVAVANADQPISLVAQIINLLDLVIADIRTKGRRQKSVVLLPFGKFT
jgi:hypothetical protein